MPTELFESESSAAVVVTSTPTSFLEVAPWFAEVVLMLRLWKESGMLRELNERVRVPRGRAGQYSTCDFVLLLIAYAVSGEPTIKRFFVSSGAIERT